jgi:two-component system chemotaxis response regulator CheB
MITQPPFGGQVSLDKKPFVRNTAPFFHLVAMACSAGGLLALKTILTQLPASFPAPVLIVMHTVPHYTSMLPSILARMTALRVKAAEHQEQITAGVVFTAPPDYHLLVDKAGALLLEKTEPVHFLRPAADPLLNSIASHYGVRAVAVILSGNGQDGSRGIQAIKAAGGTVIAQSLESAAYQGMPGAAIRTGSVDRVLPVEQIAVEIQALVAGGEWA